MNVPLWTVVPPRVPVPLPLSAKVTPVGSPPDSVMPGTGDPEVVTVNDPGVPAENVVAPPLVMAGTWFPAPVTVRVKVCTAFGFTPFVAVKVIVNVPPALGIPLRVPEPLPLSTKVTPMGSAPDSVMPGKGDPVAVTVKNPGEPTANVALFALVMAGAWLAAALTVRVKSCWEALPTPLSATKPILNMPLLPGVPLSVPVPFPLSVKAMPLGKTPDSVMAGVGVPVVVTVNDPGAPSTNVALFALVKDGA